MANINRVVLVGNPGATRARAAPSTWPRAGPSASTAVSTGASGRPRTAPSDRRSRSSPTASSSSAVAATPRLLSRSSCPPPRRRRARPTSRPQQTTTSPSDGAGERRRTTAAADAQAHRPARGAGPEAQLLLLQGEDRGDRLQEREPAAPLHLGAGQDPLSAHHRRLPQAPASGRSRRQAGSRDGASSLRHGLMCSLRQCPPSPPAAAKRRHAASSVAPISNFDMGAPCVLAWLAFHSPEAGEHRRREH